VQLLGRAKFLTEDENPKEKVKFLKGGEFPKGGREIPRNFAPRGRKCRGGKNPGTPDHAIREITGLYRETPGYVGVVGRSAIIVIGTTYTSPPRL
jgi:hypothetical protein